MARAPLITEGALAIRGLDHGQKLIALELGVVKQLVSQWAAGTARPSIDVAYKLERRFGIPMASWCRLARPAALDHTPLQAGADVVEMKGTREPSDAA